MARFYLARVLTKSHAVLVSPIGHLLLLNTALLQQHITSPHAYLMASRESPNVMNNGIEFEWTENGYLG